MFFGIGGCVVLWPAISPLQPSRLHDGWNAIAATLRLARLRRASWPRSTSRPARPCRRPGTGATRFGVMVAGSWLFAYTYWITFIAGEVKRPDKTIILANLFAILVPGVFMIWTGARPVQHGAASTSSRPPVRRQQRRRPRGLHRALEHATSSACCAMVDQNKIARCSSSVLSFLAFDLWWVALSYLAFPRIIFAWGMDRMGPKWFTDINPRFASPVKNHVLCFVLGQIMIAIYIFWQQRRDAEPGRHRPADLLGVRRHRHRRAALPVREAGRRGIWDASPYKTWKLPRSPGGDARRASSTSSTSASWRTTSSSCRRPTLEGFTNDSIMPHRGHVGRSASSGTSSGSSAARAWASTCP